MFSFSTQESCFVFKEFDSSKATVQVVSWKCRLEQCPDGPLFMLVFCIQIFRETKESELQCLLKSRRDLEAKLTKYGHVTQEDLETSSRLELASSKLLIQLEIIGFGSFRN